MASPAQGVLGGVLRPPNSQQFRAVPGVTHRQPLVTGQTLEKVLLAVVSFFLFFFPYSFVCKNPELLVVIKLFLSATSAVEL
jgi:hypothetical protein